MRVNDRVKYVLDNPKMNVIYVLKLEKLKWKINSNMESDIVNELIICEKKINNLDNIMQMQEEVNVKSEVNSNYSENKSDICSENNMISVTDKMISECETDNSINKNFNSLISDIDNENNIKNNNNVQHRQRKMNKKGNKPVNGRLNKGRNNNNNNNKGMEDTRDVNGNNDSVTDAVSNNEVVSHEMLSIDEINRKTEEFRRSLMQKYKEKKKYYKYKYEFKCK